MIAAFELFAIAWRDADDELADIFAIDERFDGAKPDGTTVEFGMNFGLLGVAEAGRTACRWEEHRETVHASPRLIGRFFDSWAWKSTARSR